MYTVRENPEFQHKVREKSSPKPLGSEYLEQVMQTRLGSFLRQASHTEKKTRIMKILEKLKKKNKEKKTSLTFTINVATLAQFLT